MPTPLLETRLFAVLLGVCALALGVLHATDAGQDALMRRFHLRPASTAEWVALQPLPGMYNFANRSWTSRRPVAWERLDEDRSVEGGEHFNHYPTRVVTFASSRAAWGRHGCPDYVYVESAVRGRTLRSRFRLDRDADRLRMSLDVSEIVRPCVP